jgi:spore germination protein GerM
MDTKRLIPLVALFLLLIVLVVMFFTGGKEKRLSPETNTAVSETEEGVIEERPTRTIVLYFLSDNDYRLHPEEREIFTDIPEVDQVKQTLEELLKGSLNDALAPLPEETRLREIFFAQSGVVYVDFSRELYLNHMSGSAAEMATVFAIVNPLVRNFESIQRVFILVEGTERETLNGHVDLTRPLLPRFDLIAGGR